MKSSYPRWAGVLAAVLMIGTRLQAADLEKNLEKTFRVNPGGKLVIQADRGSITATTDGGDQVRVRIFREVKGGNKSKGEELLANHEVSFRQEGNAVTVIAKDKRKRAWSFSLNQAWLEVRYEVTLPKRFMIDFQTAGGDVKLTDLEGDAKARTTSGSIHFGKIDGQVEVADAGGDIVIQEAGGDLAAHTTSGSIRVVKGGGKIEVRDAGGNIEVLEAAGDLKATTTSGRIVVGMARGEVEAVDAGGDIRIEAADKSIDARTTSGTIRIHSVRGPLKARDAGGDIIIDQAAGDVVATTTSGSLKMKRVQGHLEAHDAGGDIRVEEIGGDALVQTTSGPIVIGLVKGKLDARGAGSDITVSQTREAVTAHTTSGSIRVGFGVAPQADCRLEAIGGGIQLTLPGSAALDLDAHSAGGEIKSDLPVTRRDSGRSPTGGLRGKINGGGPVLTLRASSGDIQIKASAAAAPAPVQAEDEEHRTP